MTDTTATKISPRLSLVLFLAVLLLAVPQAALLPLIDRDEPRFAEAAREMVQSGHFVVPTFNGVPRYDKPPLIYWCQAVAYEIFGQNAFAARLPSVLATAATAVLIYTWGVRLGSEQLGLGAALSYSFCLQTVQQGRVATADALLIFFMTLTAFAGWLIVRRSPDKRTPFACHAVLALGFAGGFLAKGPEAWLPLIAILWCARGRRVGVLASFVAGLALMLLWGVPAYFETNGNYLWRSWKAGIADRAWGSDQGHGAASIGTYLLELPYYVLLFWVSSLLWSALIVYNARRLLTRWKLDLADRYLLLSVIPLWVIFTLMATKLPHYTLPTFPMLALLLLRRWRAVGLSPGIFTEVGWVAGIGFALLVIVAVPPAIKLGYSPSPVGDLVRQAGDNLKPEAHFALIDFEEPTAIWEMRRVTIPDAELLPDTHIPVFMDEAGPRAVIITTEAFAGLQASAATASQWKLYRTRGFNAAKGRMIDLTMIVKP